IRFAKAHLLNNLYSNIGINGGYGVGVTCQAQVLVEGNYFENTPTPILISTVNDPGEILSGDPAGFVKTLDNFSTNSGLLGENLSGYNFDPKMYYDYTSIKAQSVKEIVMQNAGTAKLNPVAAKEMQNGNSPLYFNLAQNYPNPFNPETVIRYHVAENSIVSLKVFDIIGNEVATLVDELQAKGIHQIKFSLKNNFLASGISAKGGYASGVYFYRLQAGNFIQMKKMILLK
ncbi:MAG: T9SS type A sorting domain-containing protein, partial [Candidatus Magasanikbacteria bacterium]|nr:T9SS type A sorting domain-containing protein [Candidatus Magasanikbacteria bacterium]